MLEPIRYESNHKKVVLLTCVHKVKGGQVDVTCRAKHSSRMRTEACAQLKHLVNPLSYEF